MTEGCILYKNKIRHTHVHISTLLNRCGCNNSGKNKPENCHDIGGGTAPPPTFKEICNIGHRNLKDKLVLHSITVEKAS